MFQFLEKFLNSINTKSKIVYTRMFARKYVRNIIFFSKDRLKLLIKGFSFNLFLDVIITPLSILKDDIPELSLRNLLMKDQKRLRLFE